MAGERGVLHSRGDSCLEFLPMSPILAQGAARKSPALRQDGKKVGEGWGGPEACRPPGKQEPVAKCRHTVMLLRA